MTAPDDPRDLFGDDPVPPFGDDPVERELRRSLAARAQDAPDADALTERLLAAGAGASATGGATPIRRRGWKTWGTPLVAAACVAAIVGIVLAIVRPGHSDGGPDTADSPSLPVPTSTSVTAAPSTASSAPTSTSASAVGASGLRNFRVIDLTFTSTDAGWALGSATCLNGSGLCTALLHTTDGTTWTGHKNTPFQVPGVDGCPAATCVSHIRFANADTGYAFGPDALFMTKNGGQSWQPQIGGADALETLNDNVIRVSGTGGLVSVSTAPIGSSTWTSRDLPDARAAGNVTLARTTDSAYLESLGSVAKGTSSVLWTSSNDGRSWTKRGEICPSGSSVVSGAGVSPAPDGSVALVCASLSGGRPSVVVGTDAGRSLSTARSLPTATGSAPFVAAASRSTLLTGVAALYRSTNAGSAWTARPAVDLSGGVTFAGFEGSSVGRLVTGDGRTIWTTRDAGRTWKHVGL